MHRARKRTLWLLLALLLAGLAGAVLWQISRARCFSLVGKAICHVETTRPLVALSFDDGPSALGIDAILPTLAAHDAHATFFLIGQEIKQRPDLARRLLATGNEIANHSYSHQRMVGHTMAFYRNEIARTDALLRQAGAHPRLFRPPYGKKLTGLPSVLQEAGYAMVLWDVEDPRTDDPEAFAREVVAKARPGSIILLHAMYRSNETARNALPLILDGLTEKGLRVVSVSELIATAQTP